MYMEMYVMGVQTCLEAMSLVILTARLSYFLCEGLKSLELSLELDEAIVHA